MKCDKCQNKAYCDEHVGIRRICKRNGYNGFAMYTNADRIRAMSDEDLAEWVNGIMFNGTNRYGEIRKRLISNEFLEWLKEEVSE